MSWTTNLSAVWLAIGIVLTTATQLRSASIGVTLGPGETVLSIWLLITTTKLLLRRHITRNEAFVSLSGFWAPSAILLAAGALRATMLGHIDKAGLVHNAIAYSLVASFCVLYVAEPLIRYRAEIACRWVVLGTSLPLSILYLYAQRRPMIGPVSLWYGARFTGWAENPNQLGLAVVMLPFLAMYLLNRTRSSLLKACYGLSIISALVVGLASQSDALVVGWMAGVGTMCSALWYSGIKNRRRSRLVGLAVYVILPMVVVAALVFAGQWLLAAFAAHGAELYAKGNQGSIRIALWLHGIQAMASSPVVGLGPGAHSGLAGPFEGMDAHNTLIDWGASTGILGIVAYLLLLWRTWRASWRGRQPILLATVIAGSALSVFHQVLRQPIFWFCIATVLVLAQSSRAGTLRALKIKREALRAGWMRSARQLRIVDRAVSAARSSSWRPHPSR